MLLIQKSFVLHAITYVIERAKYPLWLSNHTREKKSEKKRHSWNSFIFWCHVLYDMYLFQFHSSISCRIVCSMSFLLQLRCFCYSFVCIMYFSLKPTLKEWRFQSDRQYFLIGLRGVCRNKCLLTVNNNKTI